jgi:hypothetical protein
LQRAECAIGSGPGPNSHIKHGSHRVASRELRAGRLLPRPFSRAYFGERAACADLVGASQLRSNVRPTRVKHNRNRRESFCNLICLRAHKPACPGTSAKPDPSDHRARRKPRPVQIRSDALSQRPPCRATVAMTHIAVAASSTASITATALFPITSASTITVAITSTMYRARQVTSRLAAHSCRRATASEQRRSPFLYLATLGVLGGLAVKSSEATRPEPYTTNPSPKRGSDQSTPRRRPDADGCKEPRQAFRFVRAHLQKPHAY